MTQRTGETRLPGDPTPRETVARAIRVDHAGEYGAKRIYEGQLAVLGRTRWRPVLEHMKAQEQVHLDTFSRLIGERRVRPTALLPVWHVAGFALGAATARTRRTSRPTSPASAPRNSNTATSASRTRPNSPRPTGCSPPPSRPAARWRSGSASGSDGAFLVAPPT